MDDRSSKADSSQGYLLSTQAAKRQSKKKKNPLDLSPRVFKLYLKALTFLTKKLGQGGVEEAGNQAKCGNDIPQWMVLSLLLPCICTSEVQKEECQEFRRTNA